MSASVRKRSCSRLRATDLYSYLYNDPINSIDPFGLQEWNVYTSYSALHRGIQPPNVDVPWGEYANRFAYWTLFKIDKSLSSLKESLLNNTCGKNSSDLNRDGRFDYCDKILWFSVRRLWDFLTPPFTEHPPGYGAEGPGSNDPITDFLINGPPSPEI